MYLFNMDPETDEITFADYVEFDKCRLDPENKVKHLYIH